MRRYRIVTDKYSGYEVQVWRWWWPFWTMPEINTHPSIESARAYARKKQAIEGFRPVVVEVLSNGE